MSADNHPEDNPNRSRQRIAPKSREMEEALLAALLVNNELWERVEGRLQPEDFSERQHRQIYAAMARLLDRGASLNSLTLIDELRSLGQLSFDESSLYINKLEQEAVSFSPGNFEHVIQTVRDRATMRALIGVCEETIEDVYQPRGRDARDLLELAETRVFQLGNQYRSQEGGGFQRSRVIVAETVEYVRSLVEHQSAVTGLSTGFRDLDYMTAGLQPGELIIVGGRPSMGKTTFVMNIAETVARNGFPTAIYSLEMPARSLMLRMISTSSRIPHNQLRVGNLSELDMNRLALTVNELRELPLFIDNSSHMTMSEMRSRARRLKREQQGLGLIVVDYLQLMQPERGNDSRVNQMTDISRGLKLLAKELNVPVIALSQLNRALESRENKNKRPKLSDLRDSGSIEQDADVVMFVYRDSYYGEANGDRRPPSEIIIAKQRNGELGTVNLNFEGQFLRFSDLNPGPDEQAEGQFHAPGSHGI